MALKRTTKSCGPDASTPASSQREATPLMTVTNKPDHRGRARRKPLKPLRGECRAISGVTVVTNARVYYTPRAGCGRIGRPAFPAPSDWRGRILMAKLARNARRDREVVSAKKVGESDHPSGSVIASEAKQSVAVR